MTDVKATPSAVEGLREVTGEEVAFFDANGWVKLDALFSTELAGELLRHIRATFSARVDGEDDYVEQRAPHLNVEWQPEEVAGTNLRESDDWVASLAHSRQLGEVGARLLGTRPLRLFQDAIFYKRPLKFGKWSGATPWHQDYPSMPMDRANGVQIWVAATEVTPDMGMLRYLSGSHRGVPPLGKVRAYRLPDGSVPAEGAVAIYPWLLEQFEMSPSYDLQPGDAFAHHTMTMHCAEPNSSPRERWAWAVHYFDARVAYNGAPNLRTDDRGLRVNEVFDSPSFPVVVD